MTVLELNEKIVGITNKISDRNPELLKYLDEMPVTVPYQENPEIAVKTLTTYYDSLVNLLYKYEDSQTKKNLQEKAENLPITEIITMELDNSYQSLLIEDNDITTSYYDIGEGIIPIIFVHGFPFDKSMWKGQLESLKSSYRVIAYDIRGFGKTMDETTKLSIDLFSDDLLSFMDKLNIKEAILCGLSMGGYICLNAQKRFPERFKGLILCDTQCIADTAEVKEKRYKTIEQINVDGVTEFDEKFIKSVFHEDSLTNKMELVENLRSIVFANSKGIITAGLTALAERAESCNTLNTIDIPTLIICGREDTITPLAQSEFMHEHIKGSILEIIDLAGHVSNLEQPDEFNKYLINFLNSLPSVMNKEITLEPITY